VLALAVGCVPSPVPAGAGGAGGQAGTPVIPVLTSPDVASPDVASPDVASPDVAGEAGRGDSEPAALPDAGPTPAHDGPIAGDGGPIGCIPALGQVRCGGTCTELGSDSKNCGACDTVCASNQFCNMGKCDTGCAAGEGNCGQSCAAGKTISIKSLFNGNFASARGDQDGFVSASANVASTWETFDIVDAGNGLVALKSHLNSLFVTAELDMDNALLHARASSIDTWETFSFVLQSNGSYGIKSNANGMYVSVIQSIADAPLGAVAATVNQTSPSSEEFQCQ
jgi:hypothetical protein